MKDLITNDLKFQYDISRWTASQDIITVILCCLEDGLVTVKDLEAHSLYEVDKAWAHFNPKDRPGYVTEKEKRGFAFHYSDDGDLDADEADYRYGLIGLFAERLRDYLITTILDAFVLDMISKEKIKDLGLSLEIDEDGVDLYFYGDMEDEDYERLAAESKRLRAEYLEMMKTENSKPSLRLV
ncbi:hypothetical protein EON81_12730 [bacterium]|nr:MAG: hypothetical protein EON81_12730 [bacterium]